MIDASRIEGATLGQRMKSAAKAAGLGAYKIARAVGVYAPSVYSWWKDDDTPSPENLEAYAKAVGTTVKELRPRQAGYDAVLADLLGISEAIAEGRIPDPDSHEVPADLVQMIWEQRHLILRALNQEAGGDWSRLDVTEKERIYRRYTQRVFDAARARGLEESN